MKTTLQTVVETQAFIRQAEGRLTGDEREDLINLLAADPACGTSLGGGIYKVRFGRRGAFRVIYLFAHEGMPLFLLTVFAKNEKANLSPTELAALVKVAKGIIDRY